MSALAFWKAVVNDRSNFLERTIDLLEAHGIRYCVIGGVAVNAYAEPVVTQDLAVVIDTADLTRTRALLEEWFTVREFEHSLNVRDADSGLLFQVQLDPTMPVVIERAERREVLGLILPVAAPDDLVRLKSEAALDPARRRGKRGKDILDLARLVSTFPHLLEAVPPELRARVSEYVDPPKDDN